MKRTILLLWVGLLLTGGVAAQQPVRNVIYMIGDGMGLAQVSMLMVEEHFAPTAFDRVQNVALSSTYSANNRVTDSAAAGTALATGHKTNNKMLGQTPDGKAVESLIARASDQGMPTGIAVTCYLQHATPAAFYAHVPNRDDSKAITADMLTSKVDVLIGGGRRWLAEECTKGGSYLDAFAKRGYTVVESLDQADRVQGGKLLCAAAEGHLPRAAERGDFLPDATEKALEILSAESTKSGTGFVLLVEGSQIDMAGHANDAKWLLAEMRDFERAVAVAMDFADRTPGTLVVITADHETGGVTLPGNEDDFTQAESGVQTIFSSGGHTATLVPVYLYGAGADRIAGVLDNTELSQRIAELLAL